MIEKYQIKKVDEEEILLIYLNYSYEFGNLENNIFNNLKKNIKEYMAKLKIKFKGTQVLLIVGGISLATLYLTPKDLREIDLLNTTYTSQAVIEKFLHSNPPIIKEGTLEDEIVKEIETPVNSIKINNDKVSTENISNKIDNENITSNENINNNNQVIENNNIINEPVVEELSNDDMVAIYRSNGTILEIPFEEYIIGVVAAEMPASFNIEALKAQAVVARTYAKLRLSKGLILTDTVSTQVYKDNIQLKGMWGNQYDYYYSKIKNAVDATKSQAIYYQGNYIDAVYHSTSNGNTESAEYVWGKSIPYLKSVSSPWDISSSTYLKTEEKTEQLLFSTLGLKLSEETEIEIISRNESGRITEMKLGENTYDGVTLRNILGLRSADFDLEVNNGNLIVTTRGYGHGVGMSQYGANGMAKEGYSYIQILKHYYTGVSIY